MYYYYLNDDEIRIVVNKKFSIKQQYANMRLVAGVRIWYSNTCAVRFVFRCC